MNTLDKAKLLERFSTYLDNLEPVDTASVETQDRPIDLYQLFTELAGLRSEVKLESRQVKQALEHSHELIDSLQKNNQRLSQEISARRSDKKAQHEESESPLLLEIVISQQSLILVHNCLQRKVVRSVTPWRRTRCVQMKCLPRLI